MYLIRPSFEIYKIMAEENPSKLIEKCGRTCYQSQDKITKESSKVFVDKIKKLGHESVMEHSCMTVKFICDRGVSHELVRHRLCTFSQESTRYCNYKNHVTFILPPWIDNITEGEHNVDITLMNEELSPNYIWLRSMKKCEDVYHELLNRGWSPQKARGVLPNALRTEIVMTTNFREWNHIFKLRSSLKSHPQMVELITPLRDYCINKYPEIFKNTESD